MKRDGMDIVGVLFLAFVAVLIVAALGFALAGSCHAEYKAGRRASPVLYNERGKPLGEEWSQGQMRELAEEVGYGEVGYLQAVVTLDLLRTDREPRLVVAKWNPAGLDTVFAAPWPPGKNIDKLEKSYILVMGEGGGVPDSVLVTLEDGSYHPIEVRRKR